MTSLCAEISCFRYYGPCKVLQKVGKVAYKLELPLTSKIHPVIHVSLLKKAVVSTANVSPDLPHVESEGIKPSMILGTRWRASGEGKKCQVLVRWQGLSDALSTWEDQEEFQARFPEFPAWGQAGSQGERNVMDLSNDVAFAASGKQRRRLRRARRRPARISGPEWTH